MEDLPGTWIEVDELTYAEAPHDARVVSGQLIRLPKTAMIDKLRPGDSGTCCDPRDICIVVPADQPHIKWSINRV